jgi:hypothetical protein
LYTHWLAFFCEKELCLLLWTDQRFFLKRQEEKLNYLFPHTYRFSERVVDVTVTLSKGLPQA